ncbi:GM23598 [Drosophila sechellia]|uniref:GM23598 n=2 Tax=Drosophila sechellia TaxID=7238 RepID=B4HFA1_DROSE|nr:GM23598 [Drosophila sechellia]
MSLQKSASFSLTINQNAAIVSRTNSRTICEAFKDFMDFWDIGNAVSAESPVLVSSYGASNLPQIVGNESNVYGHLATPVDAASGGWFTNNLEILANNNSDANNKLNACYTFISHKRTDSEDDSPEIDIKEEDIQKTVEVSGSELNTEPMAFLQGLNSGNLMQFSQQSVLREMMLQDIQIQSNTLPKLENHNIGGYSFSMVLDEKPKSQWMYSIPLNKLYIRMNKAFNVDVQFKSKMPIQPLNLRVFLCFTNDVSAPVVRCQNHLSIEPLTANNAKMRDSLLRGENPNSVYCGTAQGKGISERFSVVVPLNMSRSVTGTGLTRQTLAFKFVCQNSCIGRKETSLVFCLEKACGDIVGQHVIHVKICTCPKRDRIQDERQLNNKKRKSVGEDTDEDEPAKVRRCTAIKTEDTESNDSRDSDNSAAEWNVSRTQDGDYRLTITCPKKECLLQSIEGMIKEAATEVLRNPNQENLRRHANKLLSLKKSAHELP